MLLFGLVWPLCSCTLWSVAEEMASGKDAKAKAKAKARLADVCVGGQGPLQAAARMGSLDVVRCMVEELGFDINVGSSEMGTCTHGAPIHSLFVMISAPTSTHARFPLFTKVIVAFRFKKK
jgi:hypothetical protein